MHTVEASVVMAVVFLSIAMTISFAYQRRSDVVNHYKEATVAMDEADALNENEAEDYMRLISVVADFANKNNGEIDNGDD